LTSTTGAGPASPAVDSSKRRTCIDEHIAAIPIRQRP
jgi:hypothetical protein